MDYVFTAHKWQEWDDSDWSSAIGFVSSFDNAYLWARSEVNKKMKDWHRTAEELKHKVQLIETAEQFKYFEKQVGYLNSIHEGQNKIKYPVILPANASDQSSEFEIIYYVGVDSTWNCFIDVLRWKFVRVPALPVVVSRFPR